MGDYRVSAVNNNRVVASLVEHTEVNAEDGRIIDAATHAALIGGNYHQMIVVNFEIGNILDERLYHLVSRLNVFKAVVRDSVLNSCVVRVKGDEVVHSESAQLLKSHGAVKGFSA